MLNPKQLVEIVDLLKKGERCVEWNVYGGGAKVLAFLPGRSSVVFDLNDLNNVERELGEPLSVVPDVLPYALPVEKAAQQLPDYFWKEAVRTEKTILGRDEYRQEFARGHLLRDRLQEVTQ